MSLFPRLRLVRNAMSQKDIALNAPLSRLRYGRGSFGLSGWLRPSSIGF